MPPPARFDVVIVGGGHGGATVASGLRQHGFAGSVALLSEETHLPYERPPLSKEYLAGERALDRMWIRPQSFWDEREIHIHTGHPVVEVEPISQRVVTSDGSVVAYRSLVWAAGGRARQLRCPGSNLVGIHALRTLDDADALQRELIRVQSVVVIGGGFIGLEAAAVLRKWGKTVTLIESLDRVLARVAGEPLSAFFGDYHRSRGVDLRLGQSVVGFEGKAGRVSGVNLGTGVTVPAELVIVGIGITPCIEALVTAGVVSGNGVSVDPYCLTSLPNVYAVGDCALHVNHCSNGEAVRIESVQNAHDQAQAVSRTLAGSPTPYTAIPWFWSNQYDLKLQTIGLSKGYDQVVVRGDRDTKSFSVIYLRANKVLALDCVNAAKDFMHGRLLVSKEISADLNDALANPKISLKDCVPSN